jgi:hypothetical protein
MANDKPKVSHFLNVKGFLNIIGIMSPVIITFLIFLSGGLNGIAWATSLIIILALASLVNEKFLLDNTYTPEKLLQNMSYNCGIFRIPGDSIQSLLPFRIIFHFFTIIFILTSGWDGFGKLNIGFIGLFSIITILSVGDFIRLMKSKCYGLRVGIASAFYGGLFGLIGFLMQFINNNIRFSMLEKTSNAVDNTAGNTSGNTAGNTRPHVLPKCYKDDKCSPEQHQQSA